MDNCDHEDTITYNDLIERNGDIQKFNITCDTCGAKGTTIENDYMGEPITIAETWTSNV
jgi:hypothetical protein